MSLSTTRTACAMLSEGNANHHQVSTHYRFICRVSLVCFEKGKQLEKKQSWSKVGITSSCWHTACLMCLAHTGGYKVSMD